MLQHQINLQVRGVVYVRTASFLYISLSHLQTSLYTMQPPYLYDLIALQTPRNTRSSSVVTLARPPTRSSLKSTSRSFRYASPYLWNQLPHSLRQPRLDLPLPDSSLLHDQLTSPVSSSPLLSAAATRQTARILQ